MLHRKLQLFLPMFVLFDATCEFLSLLFAWHVWPPGSWDPYVEQGGHRSQSARFLKGKHSSLPSGGCSNAHRCGSRTCEDVCVLSCDSTVGKGSGSYSLVQQALRTELVGTCTQPLLWLYQVGPTVGGTWKPGGTRASWILGSSTVLHSSSHTITKT